MACQWVIRNHREESNSLEKQWKQEKEERLRLESKLERAGVKLQKQNQELQQAQRLNSALQGRIMVLCWFLGLKLSQSGVEDSGGHLGRSLNMSAP